MVGKGGYIRTVPMPDWVKSTVDAWTRAADITAGRIFHCVGRAGKCWGEGVSERVVWRLVKQYAAKTGLAGLAPHDLGAHVQSCITPQRENWSRFNACSDMCPCRRLSEYLGCKQRIRGAVND